MYHFPDLSWLFWWAMVGLAVTAVALLSATIWACYHLYMAVGAYLGA